MIKLLVAVGLVQFCAEAWAGSAQDAMANRSISVSQIARLPWVSTPVTYSLPVEAGEVVDIHGGWGRTGSTNYPAVIWVNFKDEKGKDVPTKALPYSRWVKGWFTYLSGEEFLAPFHLAFHVPERARTLTVRIAKMPKMGDQNVRLDKLSIRVRGKNYMFWVYGCLFVFLAFLARYLNKKHCCCAENALFVLPTGGVRGVWRGILFCAMIATVAVFAALTVRAFIITYPPCTCQDVVMQIAVLVVLAFALNKITGRSAKVKIITLMVVAALAYAAILRLTHGLGQHMQSDFDLTAHAITEPDSGFCHYPKYFYWCNYEVLCTLLGRLVCPDIVVGQILNVVCCVLTIPPFFALVKRSTDNSWAVFITLAFCLSPALILFSTLLFGEFLAMLLFTLAFYLLMRLFNGGDSVAGSCFIAAGIALLLALGEAFKPITMIFAISFAVLLLLELLVRRAKGWKVPVTIFFVFLCVYLISVPCVQSCFNTIAGPQRIEKSGWNKFAALNIGLCVESKGTSRGQVIKDKNVLMKSEAELSRMLWASVKKDWKSYPKLFAQKMGYLYADTKWGDFWYDFTIKPHSVRPWCHAIVVTSLIVFLVLFVLGLAGLLLRMTVSFEGCLPGLASTILIAGFTAVIMLGEAQPRYKLVMWPFFFIVMSYARIWLEKDNPLYRATGAVSARMKEWIKTKRVHRKDVTCTRTPKS